MTTPQQPADGRRFRLAGNDNESIVDVETDVDVDVEGHRLATNDNEVVIAPGDHDPADEDRAAAPATSGR